MGKTSNNDSVARILSMAALQNGQLDSDITVKSAVGGIPAGKVYKAGTSVTTIINDMLGDGSSVVVEDVKIFYGATDTKPTSTSGLTSITVKSDKLLNGYIIKIDSGDRVARTSQYPTIALPVKYKITKWIANGFDYDIPHTEIQSGGYSIYYLNKPSYDVEDGGITYKITITT